MDHGHGIDIMTTRRFFTIFIVFGYFIIALTGCPRFAYIDAYNNTNSVLSVDSTGDIAIVKPSQALRMKFAGDNFKIKSDLGNWNYRRNVPHGGYDGPFFDGTLRIQINPDGTIYALKAEWRPPLTSFPEQPIGYPLKPE